LVLDVPVLLINAGPLVTIIVLIAEVVNGVELLVATTTPLKLMAGAYDALFTTPGLDDCTTAQPNPAPETVVPPALLKTILLVELPSNDAKVFVSVVKTRVS